MKFENSPNNRTAEMQLESARKLAYDPTKYSEGAPATKPHERLLDRADLVQLPDAEIYGNGLETKVTLPYSAVPPELRIFQIPPAKEHTTATATSRTESQYVLQPVSTDQAAGVIRNYFVEAKGFVRVKRQEGTTLFRGKAVEFRIDNNYDEQNGYLTESKCEVKDSDGQCQIVETVYNKYDEQGRITEQTRVKADRSETKESYNYQDGSFDTINVTGELVNYNPNGVAGKSEPVDATYSKETGFTSARASSGIVMSPKAHY